MALMYPWATREYLMWSMTIGQLVLYHNLGMEMKYGKKEDDGGGVVPVDKMTPEQMRAKKAELKRQYGSID